MDEIKKKYGNSNLWDYFMELFDLLPLAALLNNNMLCIHGGLSPSIKTIN